jgi:hypothetical protein
MNTNPDAKSRDRSTASRRFALLGALFVFVVCGSVFTAWRGVGASSTDSVTKVTGDSVDPYFTQPYVDVDEWRDTPVRHRYVHGGFKDTQTLFSIYFPAKEQFQGRFFQPLPAVAGVDNTSQRASGPNTPIGFAVASGAYLIDSNQGQGAQYVGDEPPIPIWRANAAVAKYSRVLANKMYGPGRVYGYVYGGSGGSYKTFGCIENTVGVWDGAVPYISDGPYSLPNNYTVKGHALRMLKGKFPAIVDAIDPGGSGDMYAGLNKDERDALMEVTRMGQPPRSWFVYERLGMGPIAGSIFHNLQKWDPTYFDDFWTKPGYLGKDRPDLFTHDRIQHFKTSLNKVELSVAAGSTSIASGGIGFASSPQNGDLIGATVTLKSGAAAGNILYISNAVNGAISVGLPTETRRALSNIKVGDQVEIDNSAYLAAQTYHRHQVPSPDHHAWDVFRKPDGTPLYPQRPALIGGRYFLISSGSTHSGKFDGKIIHLENLMDEHTHALSGDWFRSKVKAAYGPNFEDRYRLYYTDHALHGQPVQPTDNLRVINYMGILQQTLRDLTAWVEKGVQPPPQSVYKVVDGQVQIPPTAAERKGIQPVITLTANGGARADVAVGQPVTFAGVIDVPPNTGTVVAAEWDFEGAGDYPVKETLKDTQSPRVALKTTHAFMKPGTYFPALRAASQRQSDANTPYARVVNLDRVRVVVK